jgi:hypothetical protein
MPLRRCSRPHALARLPTPTLTLTATASVRTRPFPPPASHALALTVTAPDCRMRMQPPALLAPHAPHARRLYARRLYASRSPGCVNTLQTVALLPAPDPTDISMEPTEQRLLRRRPLVAIASVATASVATASEVMVSEAMGSE